MLESLVALLLMAVPVAVASNAQDVTDANTATEQTESSAIVPTAPTP